MISFKVIGMAKTLKQMGKIGHSVDPPVVDPIAMRTAKSIADNARARAPKGPTGNLKRSIKSFKGRNKGVALAVVDAKIAPHRHLVEFGTVHMPAQPYWRPAVEDNAGGIVKE